MDIQYFITFREVARCLHLTKAAERLGYAQPTISVQIQKLENHFRTNLFERSGKSLKLTGDGARLLQYADKIVEAFTEAGECFAAQEAIHLKIGTIETLAAFYLPPHLQAFRKAYPAVNLTIIPSNENRIIQLVKSGDVDLGIVMDPPFSDPELQTLMIRKEELIIICPHGHPLQGKKDIAIQDLQDSDLILTEKGCTYRAALESTLRDGHVPFQIVSELGSVEAIKQCVAFGIGAALIPRIAAAEELNKGLFQGVSIREGSLPPFYTQVVLHKNKYKSHSLKYLISLLDAKKDTERLA